jgi:hypothetical protein
VRKLLLLSLLAGALAAPDSPRATSKDSIRVSMIRLLATPEKYEGKLVQVVGVFVFKTEESALYLHREDAELLNGDNALWVEPAPWKGEQASKSLSGAFVIVAGRFTAKERGHEGAFAGTLKAVTQLDKLRTRAEYERLSKPPSP